MEAVSWKCRSLNCCRSQPSPYGSKKRRATALKECRSQYLIDMNPHFLVAQNVLQLLDCIVHDEKPTLPDPLVEEVMLQITRSCRRCGTFWTRSREFPAAIVKQVWRSATVGQ